jgi:PKD repeat protein
MKIALFLCTLCTVSVFSQDSISVLFIGNSYVQTNDLPSVFSNLTNSLGDVVTLDSKLNGGYTFQNHLVDPLTHTKIQARPWDFVVLQGQSQEPSFPTSQVNSATLPPAVSLADSIYANNYCSQAVYFMTWGRQNGDIQWDSINTFNKMNERLRNAYVRFSDSAQASTAPVGVAWKYVRDTYPTINLYSPDGSHPSAEGTYLAACTFYASLFRKSPVGASYVGGLNSTTAEILQAAAGLCVLDSLDTWHLRGKEAISIADFTIEQSGAFVAFQNESWRSSTYLWDFGDGNVSYATDPVYEYLASGNYTVSLIAGSECGTDTLSIEVVVDPLSISEQTQSNCLLQSFGEGKFQITGTKELKIIDFELVDSKGLVLENTVSEKEENTIVIDLHNFPAGLYFLKCKTSEATIVLQLPRF